MSNLILKVSYGEVFDFFDSESKKEFIVGSKRTCDVVVKSYLVAPEQLRFLSKNDVWYVEDLTPEGFKSEVLIGGKRSRRPIVRVDGDIVVRKCGERHSEPAVRISPVKKITSKKGGSGYDIARRTITLVGRNPACDIVVDNPMVSEKHFRIVFDGSDYYIEDLHSINGTFVNNRKIRRAKLSDYDRISIPAAAYTFYEHRLLYSTSPAGIQVDAVGVTKEVTDRKSRGRVKLVDAVSFRIEAGNFVAIVGGSGAGKTTLLDCLNGIRPATGGGIYYDTNNYYDNIKSYKNVMGYVPQRDIMHDDLTVEEGLFYTALLRMRTSMSRDEVRARVADAIADVRLTGKEKLRISSLSGGQRKRVSIAMELLSDPKVIFLDEPTSGLSPDLDLEMMELLKELAEKGRTIVVITHTMENLDKCDKIAFLGKGGKLCFYGEHSEVFRYFNRKSYSRIFAALGDETLCAYFEQKYRSTDQYKRLYAEFTAAYADAKTCMLPPEKDKKTLKQTAAEQAEKKEPATRAERAAERRRKRTERKAAKEDEAHDAAQTGVIRAEDAGRRRKDRTATRPQTGTPGEHAAADAHAEERLGPVPEHDFAACAETARAAGFESFDIIPAEERDAAERVAAEAAEQTEERPYDVTEKAVDDDKIAILSADSVTAANAAATEETVSATKRGRRKKRAETPAETAAKEESDEKDV